MEAQKFTTRLSVTDAKLRLPIPFNPQDVWGARQRYHVRGTINGVMVRGPLGLDGEGFFLALGAAWRRDTGIDVNTPVNVELSPEGPQLESLARDMAAALAVDAEAQMFFDGLATFYRKGYITWIEGAKRAETRAGRISEMMALLKAGKKQR